MLTGHQIACHDYREYFRPSKVMIAQLSTKVLGSVFAAVMGPRTCPFARTALASSRLMEKLTH